MISCLKALSFITEMVKLVKHANSESWFFFHGNKTQKNNNSKNLVGHKKGFSCIKRVSWMIDSCSSIEKYKWIIHELLSDTNILRLHIDFMLTFFIIMDIRGFLYKFSELIMGSFSFCILDWIDIHFIIPELKLSTFYIIFGQT